MSRVGRLGEWAFGTLAQDLRADSDVVVNPSKEDRHGWDHLLEVTRKSKKVLPADMQNDLIRCLAQIKSTQGNKWSVPVSLSNALKYAKAAEPSFVFLLRYSKKSPRPTVYGKHVWKDEIYAWLKRARETEVNGKAKLHRQTVAVTFAPEDEVKEFPGDWIVKIYEKHGDGKYTENKLKLIETLGYEHINGEGEIKIGPIAGVKDIVMHEIGVTKDLPLTGFTLHDIRFGIKSQAPVHEFGEGARIAITRPAKPVRLEFFSQSGAVYDVDASAWVSSVVPLGHPESRMRIVCGAIELITQPGGGVRSASLKYRPHNPMTVQEQAAYLFVMKNVAEGPIRIRVTADVGKLLEGEIAFETNSAEWIMPFERAVTHLLEIIDGRMPADFRVTLAELRSVYYALDLPAQLVAAGSLRIEAFFLNTPEEMQKLAAYSCGYLNGWSYGAIYAAEFGARSENAGRTTLYFKGPRVVRKFFIRRALEEAQAYLKEEFDAWRSIQNGMVAFVDAGDVKSIRSMGEDDGQFVFNVE